MAHAVFGGADEEVVEISRPYRDLFGPRLAVEERIVLEFELSVDDAGEGIQAHGADQWIGQRIVEQRIGSLRRHGPRCRHHGGRRAHAGRGSPAVAVSASRISTHSTSS